MEEAFLENQETPADFYGLPLHVKDLYNKYFGIKQLYKWQDECLKLHASNLGKNLIYTLPTSGGKTLVAEIFIIKELLLKKKNALLILPFVSIVQEKVRSLSQFAVDLNFHIEEYAGDRGAIPPRKRRAAMEPLSEREKRIIEEKRQRALALRASKIKPQGNVTSLHVVNTPYIKPPRLGSSSSSSHPTHTQPSQNISIKSAPNTKGNPSISAVCTLISKNRFQVDTVYHQESIAIFRTLPTRRYDATERKWNFNLSDHNQLENAMKALSSQVNFIPLPRFMINCLNQKPSKWHQIEGVHFAISRDGRVLLADDMGLGKTIQAIAIADYYRKEWPLLIIAPSSMRYPWKDALTQWTSHLKPDEICTMDTGNKFDPDATVTVCSFDLATKKLTDLTMRKFRVIIFDESHFLKNYRSARTKAAQALAQLAKRVILLSGTPALSRPMELYTQIALVSPGLFTSVQVFGMRYCDGQVKPWGHDYSGSSNMKELGIILEETIMIRRMKSEVITQLPSKCRQMVLLDPSAVKTGSKSLKSRSKQIKKNDLKGTQWRGVLFEYFRETAVSKLPAICNYIKDLVDSDKKFVCFAHHRIVLNGICDTLEKKKCPHIRIDGSTPSEARKLNCDKFMFNDSCRVAVLSITAANAGITLDSAKITSQKLRPRKSTNNPHWRNS
ncbi:SMARCAL1 [Cordylochernes scorpioides]|uniref:SMARCAL1 n=1 Tax=Cordylochernes scorpioides TaxID=51811 RepID=A0ABY6LRB6_9ARAC|nr:SMARCAL1 [Cordylochernes scorpioides]